MLTVLFVLAGAGKSVLWYANPPIFLSQELTVPASSTIIENTDTVRKCGLTSIAFFYHNFREDQTRDLR